MGVAKADYKQIVAANYIDKKKAYASFPDFEDAVWLEPLSVCTVRFMEYTPGGGLRQPVIKGLRDDKAPEECRVKTDG